MKTIQLTEQQHKALVILLRNAEEETRISGGDNLEDLELDEDVSPLNVVIELVQKIESA